MTHSRPPRPDPEPRPDLESVFETRDSLRHLARGLVLDEHRAEDVVHDAWVAALEKPPAPRAPLSAWLASVVRNVASNVVRRESQRPAREARAARSEIVEPEEERDLELQELVVASLRRLRQPYRTALYLRYFKDLLPRDIARRQGLPLATVKTHLRRGLALLREELDREHGGERASWCLALLGVAGPTLDPTAVALDVVRTARPLDLAAAAAATPAVAMAGGSLSALALGLGVWLAGVGGASERSGSSNERSGGDAGIAVAVPLDPPAAASPVADDGGATPAGRRVALAPDSAPAALAEAGIVGTVVDVDGRPIAGARVTTERSVAAADVVLTSTSFEFSSARTFAAEAGITSTNVFATTTDDAGRFALPPGARRAARLTVSAPGCAELAHEVPVGSEPTVDVGRLELQRGAVLFGRVVDGEGRGIAGATLQPAADPLDGWLPSPDPLVLRSVEADAEGRFRVDTLSAGRWSFVVSAPGHAPRTFEGRAHLDAPTEREFLLPRGAELAGRVTGVSGPVGIDASVRATLLDRDGEPFGRIAQAPLARDGTFRLEGCAAGSGYALTLVDASGRTLGPGVDVRAPATDVELPCDATGRVTLAVVDARTERPIPAGRLRWLAEPFGTWDESWSDGRVELPARRTSVPAELVVSAPGYGTQTRSLRLDPGEHRELQLALEPEPTVTLEVVDRWGRPLEGARVHGAGAQERPSGASLGWLVAVESSSASAWTDARGRVQVARPADGSSEPLWIEAPGHVTTEIELSATAGDEPVVVELQPAAALALRVVDDGGRPIPGALVLVERPDAGAPTPDRRPRLGDRRVRTAQDGTARVRDLEPGTVRLRAGRAGGARELELAAGEVRALELLGERSAELEGVVRVGGAPLAGASVRCTPEGTDGTLVVVNTQPGAGERTDRDGHFALAGLEPGVHTIEIEHPERAMPARFTRTLEPGVVRFDFDLDVTQVTGRVTGPSGRPVAGALVRARPATSQVRSTHVVFRSREMLARGGAVIRTEQDRVGARTDADGRFELDGVASGVPIVVVAEAPGHAPRTSEPFELVRFGRRDGVELELPAAGSIVATLAADGRPVPGAILLARPADGTSTDLRSATTDRDGVARFDDLAPGRWTLTGLASLELGPVGSMGSVSSASKSSSGTAPGGTIVDVRAGETQHVELDP